MIINKQLSMALFVIGIGSLLISWFVTAQNGERYTVLEERVVKVSANLARFETAFKTLSADIRLLHIAVRDNSTLDVHSLSLQSTSQYNAENVEDDWEPAKEEVLKNNEQELTTVVNAPTEKELETVTMIVDKLRAQDMNAYADFPALMTSPETQGLGLAAKDKMMAEVARMYEIGEIDSSFFPR